MNTMRKALIALAALGVAAPAYGQRTPSPPPAV